MSFASVLTPRLAKIGSYAMMDILLLFLMLSCLGVVLMWYVRNEALGKNGELGVFGIQRDDGTKLQEDDEPAPRYTERLRKKALPIGASALDRVKEAATKTTHTQEDMNAYQSKPGGRYKEKSDRRYKRRPQR